jgi:hypothetical protein
MGLFRKSSPKHVAADPREDAAEIAETTTPSGLSRVARLLSFGKTNAPDESMSIRRLRASADPEDDEAESELLDEERHHEEGY